MEELGVEEVDMEADMEVEEVVLGVVQEEGEISLPNPPITQEETSPWTPHQQSSRRTIWWGRRRRRWTWGRRGKI